MVNKHNQRYVVIPFAEMTQDILDLPRVQENAISDLRHSITAPDEVFIHHLGAFHPQLSAYPNFTYDDFMVELKKPHWMQTE